MAKKGNLSSMILGDVKKAEKKLTKEVAPEINELFKDSVRFSLLEWYENYDPKIYRRTSNFLSVYQTARTTSHNNILTMTVDSSLMNDYPGFDIPPYEGYEKQVLYANAAFDFMFMEGEHGHGRWMVRRSIPPFWVVDSDIQDGFNGRAQEIINKKAKKILFG